MTTIRQLTFTPLDIPLIQAFGIATGAQVVASNVLVRIVLDDGTVGLGEAAPFPAVNGETQEQVLRELPLANEALSGVDAERYRTTSCLLREVIGKTPSALAAVETALFDAICRRHGTPLWKFFGGAESALVTDITIPTGDEEQAGRDAARAARDGFATLKIKVGGVPFETDIQRLRAICLAAPETLLILDANASLSADEAIALLESMGSTRHRVTLFEQPTARRDLAGLRRVRERGQVSVAADESASSVADVVRIAKEAAADVINVKITKSGVVEAWDMVLTARALGLGVMVGGMVESELCMTTSACLAAGLGGFRYVDLDTPLFMGVRPLRGGFTQEGPHLRLGEFLGHGVDFLGAP